MGLGVGVGVRVRVRVGARARVPAWVALLDDDAGVRVKENSKCYVNLAVQLCNCRWNFMILCNKSQQKANIFRHKQAPL